MSRRTTRKTRRSKPPGWWASLDPERRRRVWRSATVLVLVVGMGTIGWAAVSRLEAHVERKLLGAIPDARVAFVDLPASLETLALADLDAAVAGLLDGAWTDAHLCRRIAERVAGVGWVQTVQRVRRTGDATFRVSADYRTPVAMLQQETDFLLVDRHAVRLPGSYRYDEMWPLIQGAKASAPQVGASWVGLDIRAGLAVLELIQDQSFVRQITAVLVGNFGGREDRFASHVELATDRAGGRIWWGSAPGREFEENTPAVKIALLRANHASTGRCDAGYPVIDISTYPDRFTVPQ